MSRAYAGALTRRAALLCNPPTMRHAPIVSLVALAAFAVACATQQQKPLTASSASETRYATHYPENVSRERTQFAEQESQATTLSQELAKFPDAVEAKDYNHVKKAYELAVESGKGAAYAAQYESSQGVVTFMAEEKEPISNGIAGSTVYVAKQKECKDPGEIGGAGVHGLNKAVDKQLEERMRSSNEAQAYIDAHAEAIGKPGVEKLRDQVDLLAAYSFLVYVKSEQSRQKLQSMVDEASTVKSTLEDAATEADALAKDPATPEGDRKSAEARAVAAREAATKIDGEAEQTRKAMEQVEQRNQKLRDEHDKAVDALLAAVDKKIEAQPAPAAAK
jgi:hypothetical protein